jgi:hypothetical protein
VRRGAAISSSAHGDRKECLTVCLEGGPDVDLERGGAARSSGLHHRDQAPPPTPASLCPPRRISRLEIRVEGAGVKGLGARSGALALGRGQGLRLVRPVHRRSSRGEEGEGEWLGFPLRGRCGFLFHARSACCRRSRRMDGLG